MHSHWHILGMGWILALGCYASEPVTAARSAPASAASAGAPAEPGPAVRVGVSALCFSHLGPGAVRLGARLLARHLSVELGRPAELQICETAEGLGRVMTERDLEVVMLPVETLRAGRQAGQALVGLVASGSASRSESAWILLTARAGPSFPPPGSTVLLADGGRAGLPSLWLREVGRQSGVDGERWRFREVIEPRPELAVLRVFLGKADGCVVSESEFVAACADNPQLSERLVRVASSPPLPGAVVCVRTSGSGRQAERLPAALERLGTSPHGRALAGLLGTGEFAPFDSGVLPAWESLLNGGSGLIARPPEVTGAPSPVPPVPSR